MTSLLRVLLLASAATLSVSAFAQGTPPDDGPPQGQHVPMEHPDAPPPPHEHGHGQRGDGDDAGPGGEDDRRAAMREKMENMPPEQKREFREKMRERMKERYKNASPEEQAKMREHMKERMKERYENASPEEKTRMRQRMKEMKEKRGGHEDGGKGEDGPE